MAAKAHHSWSQRPVPIGRQSSFPPRKSLKQSLKDIFLRTKRKSPGHPDTVGSGILRRADSIKSYLPSTTTLFSFSDRAGSQSSLEGYTISRSIPNRFQSPTHASSTRSPARQSLLPATSLSQFNLHHAYLHPSTVPQRTVHDATSPSLLSLVSHQASIASFSTLSAIPSLSTLRIQDSRQSLVPPRGSITPSTDLNARSSRARTNHVSWLHSPTASSVSLAGPASAFSQHPPDEEQTSIRSVEHFKSFCILDTAVAGCPVVATSRELCYIFEIGEPFFLNNSECDGASMDIVTGQDAAGDPITHLVLFSPLVIPSSGRSRFMLASLVDVTKFINDTASLPELDHELDSSSAEIELQTPLQDRRIRDWHGTSYKLSADDLLGGCMLADDREALYKSSTYGESREDIWLNLASEEKGRRSATRKTPRSTPKINQNPKSGASHTSTISSAVDDVLDEFMSGLQELYSEFFLLGKSPLDDTCFEICNVSPVLFQSRDYINGHLSYTGHQQMAELSAALAQGSPFDMPVKWGPQGTDRRMYCSPMYTVNSTTWICFLVEHHMPLLW